MLNIITNHAITYTNSRIIQEYFQAKIGLARKNNILIYN